jgi:hypothetical protein
LSGVAPLVSISVGVLVERSKSASQWSDFLWRAVGVLIGVPDTPAWTRLSDDGARATFYAGAADVELHRGVPSLWVALGPTDADPPYKLLIVTADPAEGEAMTGAGNNLVEAIPMPLTVQEAIAQFIAEHHVETQFSKRKRDRANPEALARQGPSDRRNRE